jgi:hypothetical protein
LFRNSPSDKKWLEIRLEGDGVAVNRSAIGAQARITVDDKTYTRQVEAGTGEGNQNQLQLHFGLGDTTGPVDIQISWPGSLPAGKRIQAIKGLEINKIHHFRYGGSQP